MAYLPIVAYFFPMAVNFSSNQILNVLKSQKKDAITTVIAWELFDFMLRTFGFFPFWRVRHFKG